MYRNPEYIIIWYQAGGDIKAGDYVVCFEDPIICKWDGKNGIPLGRAIEASYTSEYHYGDRVPTKSIWYYGRLKEVLKIGEQTFYRGTTFDYIKRKVAGLDDMEIWKIYEAKRTFDEIIYKLKKMREEV